MAPVSFDFRRRSRCKPLPLAIVLVLTYYATNCGSTIRASIAPVTLEPILCTGEDGIQIGAPGEVDIAGFSLKTKAIVVALLLAMSVAGQVRNNRLAGRPAAKLHDEGHGHEEHDWLEQLNHTIESGLGSGILGLCALLSMMLANLEATSGIWGSVWSAHLGPPIGGHALTVKGWINEGLMALFFFNVGLEIKKELTEGALASPSKAALPCIAAMGGMVVPMAVYFIFNKIMPGGGMDGITVPMATDIAFAMGVFSLFKRSMPASSSPFLLALATADDLGAIAVIAVVFAGTINVTYLALAAATLIAAGLIGKRGISGSAWFFVVPGVALWYFMLRGGVNADVAGVLVALCVPMYCSGGHEVVERLVHRWTPVCSLFILPVFALANCAVDLRGGGEQGGGAAMAVPYGIAFGLVIGKPLGIFSFTWLSCRFGLARMPKGMNNMHLLAVGMLGSIGFTMCLFLIECSLSGQTASVSKLAVLLASVASAAASGLFMSSLPAAKEEAVPANVRGPTLLTDSHQALADDSRVSASHLAKADAESVEPTQRPASKSRAEAWGCFQFTVARATPRSRLSRDRELEKVH